MATAIRLTGVAGHRAHRGTLFGRIAETLAAWHKRALARGQLAELDDRLLADVGLTRWAAEQEIRKPFWRA